MYTVYRTMESLEKAPMTEIDPTNRIFHFEEEARCYLEEQRWPVGVTCPFCGLLDQVKVPGSMSHVFGSYHCNPSANVHRARRPFMERSHLPLRRR